MTRIKLFLCTGSYDKRFCTKSWQTFANLLLMCKLLSNYFLEDVECTVAISLTCISNLRQGQLRGALGENVEVTVATVTSHTV